MSQLTRTEMKTLRKIQTHLQIEIDTVIKNLLYKTKFDGKFTNGIKGYIADVRAGKALYDGRFTVPYWAFKDKRKGYFIWYVAHELSHQLRYKVYGIDGCHDMRFYELFLQICPDEFQHFEVHYKPSCVKYGISKNKS